MMMNKVSNDDRRLLEREGRVFGLSIALPALDENHPDIQKGPAALALAADYYATALNEAERNTVVMEFHEGVRQYANISTMELSEMLKALEKQRK